MVIPRLLLFVERRLNALDRLTTVEYNRRGFESINYRYLQRNFGNDFTHPYYDELCKFNGSLEPRLNLGLNGNFNMFPITRASIFLQYTHCWTVISKKYRSTCLRIMPTKKQFKDLFKHFKSFQTTIEEV